MMLVILWLGLAVAAGVIARTKGRSGFGYFVLGLLVPLIGTVIAIGVSSLKPVVVASSDKAPVSPAAPPGGISTLGKLLILVVAVAALALIQNGYKEFVTASAPSTQRPSDLNDMPQVPVALPENQADDHTKKGKPTKSASGTKPAGSASDPMARCSELLGVMYLAGVDLKKAMGVEDGVYGELNWCRAHIGQFQGK